ncbi:MAG: acetate uptake transporter [Deltaproteobacteria bacterium]|jgi:succinate-acetate transporter protein|nr:acetate uptake transporter [Deltaproteobacteria bacterium]
MPITLANPTPLGLVTFGLSTILLSLSNAGLVVAGSPIMAQGLFVGGLAQMLAGIMEFVKGNTFGCVVFTSFGGFWMAVTAITFLPVLGWAEAATPSIMGSFMFIWAIYVFLLLIGIFKGGRVLSLIVTTLLIVLVLLAIGSWTGSAIVNKIAGYLGLICGGSALYLGCAITLEETNQKKVLPF